jgi:hypothetical protein
VRRVLWHGAMLTPIENPAVFSHGVFESPKWDVDPYDELVLKAPDQLRLTQDVALHRALKITF